jgi:hypothetical protein
MPFYSRINRGINYNPRFVRDWIVMTRSETVWLGSCTISFYFLGSVNCLAYAFLGRTPIPFEINPHSLRQPTSISVGNSLYENSEIKTP